LVDLLWVGFGDRISNHPKFVLGISAFLMVAGGSIVLYSHLYLDDTSRLSSLLVTMCTVIILFARGLRALPEPAPIPATGQPSGSESEVV
jgi:hypothetical protein